MGVNSRSEGPNPLQEKSRVTACTTTMTLGLVLIIDKVGIIQAWYYMASLTLGVVTLLRGGAT